MFTIRKSIPHRNKTNKEKTDGKAVVNSGEDQYVLKTSVRRMVEFLLREGDIRSGGAAMASQEAMLEGGRLHRKIQRDQGPDYASEVPLSLTFEGDGYTLILEGRADGIELIGKAGGDDRDEENPRVLIDEIKCIRKKLEDIREPDPLHLAQAKCYAAIYVRLHQEDRIGVQISYCQMETEEILRIRQDYGAEELKEWFDDLMGQCRMWADYYVDSRRRRDKSIEGLAFPFPFRPGQRQLTAMAFRAMNQGRHVFLQAPTGVGKTISMIYPALRELFYGDVQFIYYLTAKTITRTVAEDTLSILRKQELALKSVTITAKEKICILDEAVCDPELCPRAKGHYDRVGQGLFDMLSQRDDLTRECILEYSERYKLCPYELASAAARWADAVICDYNYIFDPHVSRGGLLSDQDARQSLLLVDEAHNLMDRAREMYSADLGREDFKVSKAIFKDRDRKVYLAVRRCDTALRNLAGQAAEAMAARIGTEEAGREEMKTGELSSGGTGMRSLLDGVVFHEHIDSVYHPLFGMLERLTDYLTNHEDFQGRDEVLDFYFRVSHFFMILDSLDEGYQIWTEGEKMRFRIHLFCIDPSGKLSEHLEACRSSIFFSATLLPIPYYRSLLGGGKIDAYAIPSPFPQDHRLIAVTEDVTSLYSRRGPGQYRRILQYLEITIRKKTGNYMIFFPSYEMLGHITDLLEESSLSDLADLAVQEAQMEEEEREAFLERFRENPERSLVGFCVMGSIFSEGIDLAGSRLSGVLIVGTGLPGISREREIIKQFFDRDRRQGYDYAYRYPGMNKVLQAAGRVIRTVSDRGIILLMDYRFLRRENQELFPEDWKTYYPVSEKSWGRVLEEFWGKEESDIEG